ncbi:Bug family tripartite tricarboxylate transporter substrate binding protein [Falsiroseomonas selenitidurans]|uniref:Tripartite tricarboxylate transporter substrate binding protein n=1 Tax=Falsiroseomonas selenitidurans TaxID=2716335 RepID=A0ABX1EBV1_9PROT|nr:tripartite tricarboxylate transporter substrate binding protein [Falsiroseomonas selenitidurans]NKC32395.1 tripartite tricarboxylate transporter substrate binding protein [Falsiroseomonas selenitidurans]
MPVPPTDRFRRRLLLHTLALAGATAPWATSRAAGAEAPWPDRPIRLVVPWPPGGAVDVLARAVQQPLGAALGQPLVIENIGGASGRVGGQAAARAAADGYTLLLANDTFAATEALPVEGAPALRQALRPVAQVITAEQGFFTHPRSGLASAQDFAAAARARPGALNVGVPGIGASQHLTSELLLRAAGGLRVEHVPYRGGGPVLQDLLAGNIDVGVVTFSAGVPFARDRRLLPLFVTSAARPAALPEVPTAAEVIAPGFVQDTWIGFFAPTGTPEPIRARLHQAVLAVLAERAVQAKLALLGFYPSGLGPAAFTARFDNTIETFAAIARERGITVGS